MKIVQSFLGFFKNLHRLFIKSPLIVKIITITLIAGIGYFIYQKNASAANNKPQYQTAAAEKGTLTITVNASGQVSAANSATVDTQTSGVVTQIFVENGQKVKTGDKIAQLESDLVGKQRVSQAWASYQSAKNALENAKIAYYSMHSDLLTNWKSFMDLAQTPMYENSDKTPNTTNRQLPQYMSIDDQWLSVEAKYKQQENVVAQAQTALNSSWLSYQQTSPIIYAPISGTVTGLSLQIGSVLTSQSNTSGTATSQKIASIQTDASPIVSVNLTQIDTPKVKIGDKATLTFDAFPGKTYTGKIVSIDTIGSVSSGVTVYPAVIKLDTVVPGIYSNMTTQASIITEIKNDIVLVPSSAVQTQNGQSTVRIMKNGKVEQINVETGLSSSTQTEIISGVAEGDTIITSNSTTSGTGQTRTSGQTTSVFGGGIGRGGFGR
jgi:membrane fusion protein, macrolide-specific efflux system